MGEEQEKEQVYSNDTFTIVLHESYPADREDRELHLTFSKSFLASELYKENGSPEIKERMAPLDFKDLAEKCGICLFLHNPVGPAIERFVWVDKKNVEEKHFQNMWVNGKYLPLDEFEEYDDNGTKKFRFKNHPLGLGPEALKILHGLKVRSKVDAIIEG